MRHFCGSTCSCAGHTQAVVFLQVGYSAISHFSVIAGWQCSCPLFWVVMVYQISLSSSLFFKVTPYPDSTQKMVCLCWENDAGQKGWKYIVRALAWKIIQCVMKQLLSEIVALRCFQISRMFFSDLAGVCFSARCVFFVDSVLCIAGMTKPGSFQSA